MKLTEDRFEQIKTYLELAEKVKRHEGYQGGILEEDYDFTIQSRTMGPALAKAVLVAIDKLENIAGDSDIELAVADAKSALAYIETILSGGEE